MLKFNAMTTAIRIQKESGSGIDEDGYPVKEWVDIIDENLFCEWRNKFGAEAYKNLAQQVKEPASLRMWFMPGIDSTCRIIRLEDNAVFEVVSPDNVMNRSQQLEIEVKRYVKG
jgi:head-tail adaptor